MKKINEQIKEIFKSVKAKLFLTISATILLSIISSNILSIIIVNIEIENLLISLYKV